MEYINSAWTTIKDASNQCWTRKDEILQTAGFSLIGTSVLHIYRNSSVTDGIALGCLASLKVLTDAIATPIGNNIRKQQTIFPFLKNDSTLSKTSFEFFKRCTVDLLISFAFASVFRTKANSPMFYRVFLHAYLSYTMGRETIRASSAPYL